MKTKRYSSSNHHGHLPLTAVVLNYVQSTSHAPPATSFVNQGVAIVSDMTSEKKRDVNRFARVIQVGSARDSGVRSRRSSGTASEAATEQRQC